MDTSLQMARQSNKVNSVDEMCSCVPERDKTYYLAPYLKSSRAATPPRHRVVTITAELIGLTGTVGMWNLPF